MLLYFSAMIANNKGPDQTERKTSAFIVLEISRIEAHVMNPSHPCFCLAARHYLEINMGPSRILGSWGEGLYIFRELGCSGNYFRDLRSKLIVLGILGALQKVKNKFMNSYLKGKAFISFNFF